MSDQSDGLSLADREVHIPQYPLVGIAEGYVLQSDRILEADGLRLHWVDDGTLGLKDAVDTLHRAHTPTDGVGALTELLQWIDQAVEDHQIVDEGRSRDATLLIEDQRAPIPEDDGYGGGT